MSQAILEIRQELQEFLKGPKKLYINGQFVESVSGKTFTSPNPAKPPELPSTKENGLK